MTDPSRPDRTPAGNRQLPTTGETAPGRHSSDDAATRGARTGGTGRLVLLGAAAFAVLAGLILFFVLR